MQMLVDYLGRRVVVSIEGCAPGHIVLGRVADVSEARDRGTGATLTVLHVRELEGTRLFWVLYHPNVTTHVLRLPGVDRWHRCTCWVAEDADPLASLTSRAWSDQLEETGDVDVAAGRAMDAALAASSLRAPLAV